MKIIKFTYGDNLEIIDSEPVDYNKLDFTHKNDILDFGYFNTVNNTYVNMDKMGWFEFHYPETLNRIELYMKLENRSDTIKNLLK